MKEKVKIAAAALIIALLVWCAAKTTYAAEPVKIGYTVKPTPLYKKASTLKGSYITMYRYHIVEMRSYNKSWYHVNACDGGKVYTGYVQKKYIKNYSTEIELCKDLYTEKKVALKERKDASSKTVKTLKQAQKIMVKKKSGNWLQVEAKVSGKKYKGYIRGLYTSFYDYTILNSSGYATAWAKYEKGYINAKDGVPYKEPGGKKILNLWYKEPVKIIDIENDWWKIQVTRKGKKTTGYIKEGFAYIKDMYVWLEER